MDGDVYDVTKFAGVHPGGTQILLEYAGKDAGHAVMQEYERERETTDNEIETASCCRCVVSWNSDILK